MYELRGEADECAFIVDLANSKRLESKLQPSRYCLGLPCFELPLQASRLAITLINILPSKCQLVQNLGSGSI